MKLDDKIRSIVDNKKLLNVLFIIIITILAIIARILVLSFESGDYIYCLKPWMDEIRTYGGLKSLKYEIGNYNILYMTIMAIFSYIPISSKILIKVLSIVFDFIIGIFGALITKEILGEKDKDNKISILTYVSLIMLPTVFLNSALWGQCDSMYVGFTLISLYYLLKDKNMRAFIFAGLAFACKLQFIFILPIYIVLYFKKKNFSIFNFLIIPLVNFITCIPAIIAGRSIKECLCIYIAQTGQGTRALTLNFPNIYKFVPKFFSTQGTVLVIFTLLILGIVTYIILKNKTKFTNINIIGASIMYVLLMVSFLPYMHERYGYCAEVLMVIYVAIRKKDFWMIAVSQVAILSEYFSFLGEMDQKVIYVFSIAYIIMVGIFTTNFLKELSEKKSEKIGV